MRYAKVPDGMLNERSRVAFGHFDGMHLGHKAVLERLPGYEAQVPVVLSFEEKEAPVLSDEQEKRYLLRGFGISRMISVPSEAVTDMDAETFVQQVLCRKLRAASVVAGENLVFGSDKKGVKELREYGEKYGFAVDAVPVVRVDGEDVSANRIARAVLDGDFPMMKRLLGHPYVLIGKIVHGKGKGRRHGMPTANFAPAANKLFPPYGVYATFSRFDGTFYSGLTNIGLRPSVDESPVPTIETWLLHFSRDIYGKKVILELCEYVRGIIKFPDGLDAVRKQVDQDLAKVRDSLDRMIEGMKYHE